MCPPWGGQRQTLESDKVGICLLPSWFVCSKPLFLWQNGDKRDCTKSAWATHALLSQAVAQLTGEPSAIGQVQPSPSSWLGCWGPQIDLVGDVFFHVFHVIILLSLFCSYKMYLQPFDAIWIRHSHKPVFGNHRLRTKTRSGLQSTDNAIGIYHDLIYFINHPN